MEDEPSADPAPEQDAPEEDQDAEAQGGAEQPGTSGERASDVPAGTSPGEQDGAVTSPADPSPLVVAGVLASETHALGKEPLTAASVEPVYAPPTTASTQPTPAPVDDRTLDGIWTTPFLLLGGLLMVGVSTWRRRDHAAPLPPERRIPPEPEPDEEPHDAESDAWGSPAGTNLPPGHPKGPKGILMLGQEALEAEAYEDALGWFETAIALDPEMSISHLCLGLTLTWLERHEQALEAYEAAARLEPGDPIPVLHQARTTAMMGRTEDTFRLLTQLQDRVPELVAALREDEAFDALRDHPRFLAAVGAL